jgi:hypothetical protein
MSSSSNELLGDNICEALKKLTFSLNKASTDRIILSHKSSLLELGVRSYTA